MPDVASATPTPRITPRENPQEAPHVSYNGMLRHRRTDTEAATSGPTTARSVASADLSSHAAPREQRSSSLREPAGRPRQASCLEAAVAALESSTARGKAMDTGFDQEVLERPGLHMRRPSAPEAVSCR